MQCENLQNQRKPTGSNEISQCEYFVQLHSSSLTQNKPSSAPENQHTSEKLI